MLLNNLKKSKWLSKKAKRLGRWNASGRWNFSTKGMKWQKSRSWGSLPSWFEWWQTTLSRRLPKLRWFKRYFKLVKTYEVVNLFKLEDDDRINSDVIIDKKLLKELNYISKENWLVKILWEWELKKTLTFKWIDAFSKTAKQQIEKTSWKIE